MKEARVRAVVWALLGLPLALLVLDAEGSSSPVMVLFTAIGVGVQGLVWTRVLRDSRTAGAGDDPD